MKLRILKSIYQSFDSWAADIKTACHQGCATCCTQAVTMTEIEGNYILDYVSRSGRMDWLLDRLLTDDLPMHRPLYTTNEIAQACLNENDIDPEMGTFDRSCPFLDHKNCSIYKARPFSCRSFASQNACQPGSTAEIPQYYLSAATAVSQLIEHLAQHLYWGNMLHILYAIIQKIGLWQDMIEQDT
ncbi:MAG: YkgJ family cysteine cluster protein, partial [Deltaproteobacteria bacterium]|nr:YkgJ family cysteine cluster protein [Deltaproteobacteria bacterium]